MKKDALGKMRRLRRRTLLYNWFYQLYHSETSAPDFILCREGNFKINKNLFKLATPMNGEKRLPISDTWDLTVDTAIFFRVSV